ncbi:octanoyltransferase [Arthroderma uncinatum]|uniref:octanoyltransferase n=1 Tax=Arthroderma uncinatum TaxID=74035 RepID=UPI00144AE5D1|nr:octanoyltransferase [Arthroderma uncinatum]KAF3482367.1 octanoyltransferase [Arthroderma uncinatum]
MRLAHLHIPNIIPFTHASRLQQTLVSRLLAYKKNQSPSNPESTTSSIPDPTILTFTPRPVYTTGRRDLPASCSPNDQQLSSSAANASNLVLPTPLEPIRHILTPNSSPTNASERLAEFHPTLRGGQTTYHGPGQLVIYTILDLRALRIGPRAHIRLLEDSVLDVLKGFGVKGGITTEDPGVWVQPATPKLDEMGSQGSGIPRKIAAVGVHLRRFVSSYGVGFCVTQEPLWYLRQIVACGLEGKEATSLEGVGVDVKQLTMEEVGTRFVQAFVDKVNSGEPSDGLGPGIDEVYRIQEGDVLD